MMKTRDARQGTCEGRERGSAVLELGICLPLLLIVLVGSMDFARLFYYSIEVADAARAGATYATQDRTHVAATAQIINAAKADAPDIASALTVTTSQVCKCTDGTTSNCAPNSCADNLAPAHYVTVAASYNFQMAVQYPGFPPQMTLTRSATMRSQ